MPHEVRHMQVVLPARLVFHHQPLLEQLLDQGFAVDVIVRERLCFKLLGRSIEPPGVVCEIPCGDEE
jgi:hypothetical protein